MPVAKPTVDDFVAFLQLQTTPTDTSTLDDALQTAIEEVLDRIDLPTGVDDTTWPYRLRTAVLIQAAHLVKVAQAPSGGESFGNFLPQPVKGVPEVDDLITSWLKVPGIA